MALKWMVILVAVISYKLGDGLPILSPQTSYPQDEASNSYDGHDIWNSEYGFLYAAVPALALVVAGFGLLLGCAWCYKHKDCKLFTASLNHLQEEARRSQPDSGFSEPVNNNVNEANNNGPISLREMQNIANNNAEAYIVSENEDRNRAESRESIIQFEPLPVVIGNANDPLERCADWFASEDISRDRLQYLREIGRGWFGRIVEGEIEGSETVAVKILNQNASLEDKARFLDEAKLYRDVRHDNVLRLIERCLQDDPWIMLFELCPMTLQQYLVTNRPKMAILNESGVPLRLICDVTSALTYLHSRGIVYRFLHTGNVLVRGDAESARCVLGCYSVEPSDESLAPEQRQPMPVFTASSDVWCVGVLSWRVWAWGAQATPPLLEPTLPTPFRKHMYQVMQLCWNTDPQSRPTSSQVHALVNHLHNSLLTTSEQTNEQTNDFEERWQRLKPNTIPIVDEHVAIIHAPSESRRNLTVEPTLSRSSSVLSVSSPVHTKSESLTNLHGSLEDVRNYIKDNNLVDPWLKDIIAGSQDDVSYYKDVSDVIKNLDNILNSEKTSSSESSHQASPSRDLSLDCKKDYPVQSSLVKSPGITNFQNVFENGLDEDETCVDDDVDTIGTLSHSFERYSDTHSQKTLENVTPDTPKDIHENLDMDLINEQNLTKVSSNVPWMCLSERVSISDVNINDMCDNVESKPLDEDKNEVNTSELNKDAVTPDESYSYLKINGFSDDCTTVSNNIKDENICPNVENNIITNDINNITTGDVEKDVNYTKNIENIETKFEQFIDDDAQNVTNNESDENSERFFSDINEFLSFEIVGEVENMNECQLEEDFVETSYTSTLQQQSELVTYINELPHSTESQKFKDEDTDLTVSESFPERSADTPSTLPIGNVDDNTYAKLSTNDHKDSTLDICNEAGKIDPYIDQIAKSCADYNTQQITFIKDESTIYLDPPNVIQVTADFLHSEKSPKTTNEITASTPKSEMNDTYDVTLEKVSSELDSVTEPTDLFDSSTLPVDDYKSIKPNMVLPREELLAFSSNFNEMNLDTPSPLRDCNFLLEVPDLERSNDQTPIEDKNCPSTPQNSPYVLTSNFDEIVEYPHSEPDLQATKLAIAENENNFNIEYLGPLTVEGINDSLLAGNADISVNESECFLAGNGGDVSVNNVSESFLAGNGDISGNNIIDEQSMLALRNELELKLPLAQTATIEPSDDPPELEWRPAEVVMVYAGALSPIAEETNKQLSAYENDAPGNTWNATDSSSSYLEPNDSTNEVTDLTRDVCNQNTYTIRNDNSNHTYTLNKGTSNKDSTISTDSLNNIPNDDTNVADDRTYNKADDSNCERISQVSPFLLSPSATTETDATENATCVYTISRTTVPTDVKLLTDGLSKATSIDSWCSNDTLFNVEDNFDDLAADNDVPNAEIERSVSTHTLTQDGNCSTYIVHDDKTDTCDTLSDNFTYTKLKEDSSKVAPIASAPYSSCSSELTPFVDVWRLQQPELIRRSPIADDTLNISPPNIQNKEFDKTETSPNLAEPTLSKINSVDISCLQDDMQVEPSTNMNDSPDYRNMASTMQSTPILETVEEPVQAIPLQLPEITVDNNETIDNVQNFQRFIYSAELRPQDISSFNCDGTNTDLLLERESNLTADMTPTYASFFENVGSQPQDSRTSNSNEEFRQFENSVRNRPQDSTEQIFRDIRENSSQNIDQLDGELDENEQPHSIIMTELNLTDDLHNGLNETYDSHTSRNKNNKEEENVVDVQNRANETYDSHTSKKKQTKITTEEDDNSDKETSKDQELNAEEKKEYNQHESNGTNGIDGADLHSNEINHNSNSQKNESGSPNNGSGSASELSSHHENNNINCEQKESNIKMNGLNEHKVITGDFISNEKRVSEVNGYVAENGGFVDTEMSTSFIQDSPTEPSPPKESVNQHLNETPSDSKEWDSDSDDSHSSSGEFIWKDGDGYETPVVPSNYFNHHRESAPIKSPVQPASASASDASCDSSGSEGDEVEFVPSSWDCRAEPSKSSLRRLHIHPDIVENKKRVVFKRQKYHCVYEYPREAVDIEIETHTAPMPDFCTYSDWEATAAEEAEISYNQLYGHPLDMYQLRAGVAYGSDYDDDFFISSSARPFESYGLMSSQFFPGMNSKRGIIEREDLSEEYPPPLDYTPPDTKQIVDFRTPDSGVEDITPSVSTDEELKSKVPEDAQCWRSLVDSGSSSESVSPSSPGGETLGGLRHTRDKLKLDLPPSPHIPSPRTNRVFNFVLEKPKRTDTPLVATDESLVMTETPLVMTDTPLALTNAPLVMTDTPLVMTEDTPVSTTALPINTEITEPETEPTFSTFGKTSQKSDCEQKIVLEVEKNEESGDDDSGIESSSKASLERKPVDSPKV